MADEVTNALARATHALPGGGETREGQMEMAGAVGRALGGRRHLVVQAGTGTGKSLAYLVPAALSGQRVVVATATKALQDQLATKDLPMVAAAVDAGLTFAVLKGRSNYLCRQRASEVGGGGQQLNLNAGAADPPDADDTLTPAREDATPEPGRLADQVRRLLRWAEDSPTGDRAELDFEPHFRAWAMVSTTARECPGAFRCPSGQDCFAEDARNRAAAADVVVVNTHLYGAHLASGGAVLPAHDIAIFDEAHEVEEVMTDSLGVEIGPGRFRALATGARGVVPDDAPGSDAAVDQVAEVAEHFQRVLRPLAGTRLPQAALLGAEGGASEAAGGDGPGLGDVVSLATGRVARLVGLLRQAEREESDDESAAERTRRDRILLAAGHLADDLAKLTSLTDDEVAWVDSASRSPSLRVSPIDVGPLLTEQLWSEVTGVLTSATVPIGLVHRLGLPEDETDQLDVGSPFDYPHHAILYVAKSIPDRRSPEAEPAIHNELDALITAAGGRTLALFTSWRAMNAAVEVLRERLPFRVLAQSDLPKPALIEAFQAEESTCLFATLGFWQGVDVPGRTLSLVTIDRIPFPRPDDPVLQARRDRAGSGAFGMVDLPRAGTLLAQGAGRLIRSAEDRGVVAVLDSRLATASYRRELLARVPPMKRSLDRAEVEAFLEKMLADA
ncbi:MAG TPA: ATP-dependent DNA helicase [Acidimicrobiales bacterium]|jgi:ATP-dependent DNA helicase DinG|nr:ATP-dependent DNA helicase [Acidimicrobiales bacterium]